MTPREAKALGYAIEVRREFMNGQPGWWFEVAFDGRKVAEGWTLGLGPRAKSQSMKDALEAIAARETLRALTRDKAIGARSQLDWLREALESIAAELETAEHTTRAQSLEATEITANLESGEYIYQAGLLAFTCADQARKLRAAIATYLGERKQEAA